MHIFSFRDGCDATMNESCACMQVQHARKLAARIEIGVDLVDTMRLFQAAVHELHWQNLFGDWRLESWQVQEEHNTHSYLETAPHSSSFGHALPHSSP